MQFTRFMDECWNEFNDDSNDTKFEEMYENWENKCGWFLPPFEKSDKILNNKAVTKELFVDWFLVTYITHLNDTYGHV